MDGWNPRGLRASDRINAGNLGMDQAAEEGLMLFMAGASKETERRRRARAKEKDEHNRRRKRGGP